ncbi:MAG TPA: AI-2E family transporter [Gemmatimonadales bacterium]|jgi:predicted PurR-regulated permease PerM|nr:AI-2E family transporter [Gemmatimonadales bacterium]
MPPAPGRFFPLPALALLLFGVMLVSVREILAPLVVFPLILLVLWPLRKRPDIRRILVASAALLVAWFFYRYSALLGPFLLAFILAYLFAPVVAWVESRGARRSMAILGAVLPIIVLLVVLVSVTLPQMWDQTGQLVDRLPQFGEKLIGVLEGVRDRALTIRFLNDDQRLWLQNLSPEQLGRMLQDNGDTIMRRAWNWGWSLIKHLWSVLGLLGYLVVTPVVTYYLLRDWKSMLERLESLMPPGKRGEWVAFLGRYDKALGGFIRGQLIEAAIVAILTTAGLMLLGVPNALLLGVTSGIFNIIPYVGIVLSAVPALVVALTMADPIGGLWRVVLVYGVVQFIDGSITGPKIVGDSSGLHPLSIMLALTIGGAVLGFVGLVLAVPIAILVKMVGQQVLTAYQKSPDFAATPGPSVP